MSPMQICDAFNANRYPFPDDATRQRQMHAEVTSRLRELHTTNEAGERRREAVINAIARGLEGWTLLVRREKAVYHTMNKLSLDVTSKVPTSSKRIVSPFSCFFVFKFGIHILILFFYAGPDCRGVAAGHLPGPHPGGTQQGRREQ